MNFTSGEAQLFPQQSQRGQLHTQTHTRLMAFSSGFPSIFSHLINLHVFLGFGHSMGKFILSPEEETEASREIIDNKQLRGDD